MDFNYCEHPPGHFCYKCLANTYAPALTGVDHKDGSASSPFTNAAAAGLMLCNPTDSLDDNYGNTKDQGDNVGSLKSGLNNHIAFHPPSDLMDELANANLFDITTESYDSNDHNPMADAASSLASQSDHPVHEGASTAVPTSNTSDGMTQLTSRDPALSQNIQYSPSGSTDQSISQKLAQYGSENADYHNATQQINNPSNPYKNAPFGAQLSTLQQPTSVSTVVRPASGASVNINALNAFSDNLTNGSLPLIGTNAPTATTSSQKSNTGIFTGENVHAGSGISSLPDVVLNFHGVSFTSPRPEQQAAGATQSSRNRNSSVYSGERSPVSTTGSPIPTCSGNKGPRTTLPPLHNVNNTGGTVFPPTIYADAIRSRIAMASPTASLSPDSKALNDLLPDGVRVQTNSSGSSTTQTPSFSTSTNQSSNGHVQGGAGHTDADTRLSFNSAAEAQLHIHVRQTLAVDNDDVLAVKTKDSYYALELKKAFLKRGYEAAPETKDTLVSKMKSKKTDAGRESKKAGAVKVAAKLTQEDTAEWHRYHGEADKQLIIALAIPENDGRAEAYAWMIVEEVLKIHQSGYVVTPVECDLDLKCSDRLKIMLQMIRDYPRIRVDMFCNKLNVQQFAANPIEFADSKIGNLWSNVGRKKQTSTVATIQPKKKISKADLGAILYTHMTKAEGKAWLKEKKESDSKFAELVEEDSGKGKKEKGKQSTKSTLAPKKASAKKAASSAEIEDSDEDKGDHGVESDDDDEYHDVASDGDVFKASRAANSPSDFIKDEEDSDGDVFSKLIKDYTKRAPNAAATITAPRPIMTPQKRARADTMDSDSMDQALRVANFRSYDYVADDEGGLTKTRSDYSPSPTKKRRGPGSSARDRDGLE